MFAVAGGVRKPLAQHAIGLAAAACAAEEYLEHGTFQQRPLRAVEAGRPGYCLGGGVSCGSGCASSSSVGLCSIGRYFFSHSSFVSNGGTSTTYLWVISPVTLVCVRSGTILRSRMSMART